MTHWYVIHTAPNSEAKADAELRRLGYWTMFPFNRVHRRRKRGNTHVREAVIVPYYPRYLFVCFQGRPHESFREIEDLPEVSGFVKTAMSRQPLVLREEIVDALCDDAMVRFGDRQFSALLMREIYAVDKDKELTMFLSKLGRRAIVRRAA